MHPRVLCWVMEAFLHDYLCMRAWACCVASRVCARGAYARGGNVLGLSERRQCWVEVREEASWVVVLSSGCWLAVVVAANAD
jgi:hypothetical protein